MKGYVSSIETLGLVDGPGVRVVIFLSGCPLRCLFCHNPETWKKQDGKEMTSEEVFQKIQRYQNYFGKEGGVTFSGGEPLLQEDFVLEIAKMCKNNNISTCLDTSGVGSYQKILPYIDLVLLDVKALEEKKYKEMTNHAIKDFLNFIDACERNKKRVWIRQVIVPSYNDQEKYIRELKDFLKKYTVIERIDLLPYHLLGVEKYQKLNLPYPLKNIPAMDPNKLEHLKNLLKT